MLSIFALNDPTRNFFTEIGDENLSFITNQLDQRDKLNLTKCSTKLYRKLIGLIYERIVIVVSFNSKSLSEQSEIPFAYSTDVTIISSRMAIKKFFRTVNKNVYDYNQRFKFPLLINMLHVYFSMVPKNYRFLNLNEDDSCIRLEHFQDTFIDCYEHSFKAIDQYNSIPNPIAISLLKLVPTLAFCEDISLPSSLYAKLYHNIQHFDHLKKRKMERGVASNISNYFRQLRDGEYFLDTKKVGAGLKLPFLHLRSIRLSFADPFNARKVLELCNPDTLEILTLDHMNCAFNCLDGITRSHSSLSDDQMCRKFDLYDLFFQNPKIIAIFRKLEMLQLIYHNGYNRVLFRKFLYCMHQYVVKSSDEEVGKGKLKLKLLQIRESTTDFSKIQQAEDALYSNPYLRRQSFDLHHASTLTVLTDLLKISDKLSIFDILDFNHLMQFNLFARCLPSMIFQKRYEYEVVDKFTKKMTNRTANLKNQIKVHIQVDCYNKGIMIPRDVVYDDVDTVIETPEQKHPVPDQDELNQIVLSVLRHN